VPEEFDLTAKQRRVWQAVASGAPVIDRLGLKLRRVESGQLSFAFADSPQGGKSVEPGYFIR